MNKINSTKNFKKNKTTSHSEIRTGAQYKEKSNASLENKSDKISDKLVRVQKYISDMGVMSRRAAEKEILAGNITINGVVADLGDKINPETDAVLLKGKPIAEQNKKFYVLLNKPSGYITTMKDEFDRKVVTDLLKEIPCRIYPVGRLDYLSEGALICTNDGDFANRVIHPSKQHDKKYTVNVQGRVTESQLEKLNSMKTLDGERIQPVDVKIVKIKDSHTVLQFILREGRNRQIRRMCEAVDLKIMQLKRISIGAVSLGQLPSGQWRFLTSDEIKSFR